MAVRVRSCFIISNFDIAGIRIGSIVIEKIVTVHISAVVTTSLTHVKDCQWDH